MHALTNDRDADLLALLDQRFGDGQLYLVEDDDWSRLERALQFGWVSDDGCVTAEGKRLSLRCQ